jgi:2-dehydropantoate 2-reductase
VKEIQKVTILGAGALGSVYASRFFEAGKFSIQFIAGGKRYDHLKNNGVTVNGKIFAIPVIHPKDDFSPSDLIIVALKYHHLSEAIHDLQNCVGDQTMIISVMNGIDSEAFIGSIYGMEKLLYCIAVGIDALRESGQTSYTTPGKLIFGEARNDEISPRVQRVQAALDTARIPHETPVDMIRMLWWKFMVNVGMNQTSAAMRAPYGVFQTSPDAQALMETAMQEVIQLAACVGVNLTEQDIADWYSFLNSLSPHGKTSMLQDIEAGRKTEIEIFAQKVVDLGKIHGIPTPVNQTLLQIIRVLEQGRS